MNLPKRKPLYTVETVEPNYTDRVITSKDNKIKSSTLTSIYNLFKTSFDSIYLTISSFTITIANYATLTYTNTQDNLRTLKFNINSNNLSGNTFSGTLNAETGVILFTGTLSPGTIGAYTINNNLVNTNSRITDLYIIATSTNQDIRILNYVLGTGAFSVVIKNSGGSASTSFRLSFRVNN